MIWLQPSYQVGGNVWGHESQQCNRLLFLEFLEYTEAALRRHCSKVSTPSHQVTELSISACK